MYQVKPRDQIPPTSFSLPHLRSGMPSRGALDDVFWKYLHGFSIDSPTQAQATKWNDGANIILLNCAPNGCLVREIGDDQLPGTGSPLMADRQIVIKDERVSRRLDRLGSVAANISGAAGYQNIQFPTSRFVP